jgi:hypothetical protein
MSQNGACLSRMWPCRKFCVALFGNEICYVSSGMRSANRMAKWLRACFQLRIGMVHFFEASWMAM